MQKKLWRMSIPEMVYPCVYEKIHQKTENVAFGHEGIFWANYGLGKSCSGFTNYI